jgi:hypothetical protein
MLRKLFFIRFCAIAVASTAVLVLYGWATHNLALMTVVPGFITMKANVRCLSAGGSSVVLHAL